MREPPVSQTVVGGQRSEFRDGWTVVLAGFCVAVFAWGFGFYGQSVYLAELQRQFGWPASLITAASALFSAVAASILPFVAGIAGRLGPRAMLVGGVCLLGAGAWAFSHATAPWQLFPAAAVMAMGWAASTGTALATTIVFWFDRRRGLALSLAMNGASASGFIVAPILVQLSQAYGLPTATSVSILSGLALLIPVVLLGVPRSPSVTTHPTGQGGVPDHRPLFTCRAEAVRDWRFWSIALPFALALTAQVGFIIHMVSFLMPGLGPNGTSLAISAASVMAMAGRIGLGTLIEKWHQRRASAASFVIQAIGLGLMLVFPNAPIALFAGSMLFGISVGNVTTLPAILIQREFAAGAFGLVVGLSSAVGQCSLVFGPALFGVLHDMIGGYTVVLAVCIVLQTAAAVVILQRR